MQKVVRFSPSERNLLAHLEMLPNVSRYIKSLIRVIRADMERNSQRDPLLCRGKTGTAKCRFSIDKYSPERLSRFLRANSFIASHIDDDTL